MIDENFMLNSKIAKQIYENIKDLPIIDYHNHLSAKEIYEDKNYENIGQIWLEGDHYKWRAMRTCGVDEIYITGDMPFKEKYDKWVDSLQNILLNPVYYWTHMELEKYFKIDYLLTNENKEEIYNKCQQLIDDKKVSVRSLIEQSNVVYIATTDDPIDDLEYHIKLKDDFKFKVMPAFRPDKIYLISNDTFVEYLEKLGECTNQKIIDIDSLEKAIDERMDFFDANGAKIADHGLDSLYYIEIDKSRANEILYKRLMNENLTLSEQEQFKSYILKILLKKYEKKNWIVQYHIGALRNINEKLFNELGPDIGCDAIDDKTYIQSIAKLLSSQAVLPKVILYPLDPNDYYKISTLAVSFQEGPTSGKIQLGAAWWHADNEQGILNHLETVAQTGSLNLFIGMLTDSRSYLSFVRHDYFRRILSNYLAEKYNNKLLPQEIEITINMAKNIAYYNAKKYFELEGEICN
ncbi:MAG: glucuronate isomerase [Mycoplasmatales bacterium]